MQWTKKGFSLIELVIALAILAAVTTIALRATSHLQDQARYQSTVHSLNDIRDAIIGPANQRNPDGTPLVTGFVSDVGRLPQYYAGGDPLAELTTNPNTIPTYTSKFDSVDTSIQISTGWQGPYIRLGAGPTNIVDGWGNVFHLYDSSKAAIPPSANAAYYITSWGADNAADPGYGGTGDITGYNLDVGITLPTTGLGSYIGTLSGTVKMLDQYGNPITPNTTAATVPVTIYVCYFGPNGSGGVGEVFTTANPATGAYALPTSMSGTFVTMGNRVLRAYAIPTVDTFNSAGIAGAGLNVSQPLNIAAIGGGQTVSNLVLRYYAP